MNRIIIFLLLLFCNCLDFFSNRNIEMKLLKSASVDSLGACQGISWQNGKVFLYGDREIGIVRQYSLEEDSLVYDNMEYKLTIGGKNLINHPTGLAYNGIGPTFIGNTIRLNSKGSAWKAIIYYINWPGFLNQKTLDGNVLNTIEDDICIQGTRPEYVKYQGKWYVATSDYGNRENEVRLYDPEKLMHASKTSDSGILFKKFTCSPWVQNLHWIKNKDILVLIQNQIEGRRWRFTYLDLAQSIKMGKQVVLKEIDLDGKMDELEGFSLVGNDSMGIAVTSSRKGNITFTKTIWK